MQLAQTISTIDDKLLIAAIAAVSALLGASIAALTSFVNNLSQLKEKRREERRKEIYKVLNDFYGPFQQYLNTSKEFYKLLSLNKPKEFRALMYFLDPDQVYDFPEGGKNRLQLSTADNELLRQIFVLGEKMETMIVEKSGLIDDPELRYNFKPSSSFSDVKLDDNGLLAYSRAHFQIMRLAAEGKLLGESERFKDYVFPRELPVKIEQKILALQAELEVLNNTTKKKV